MISARFCDQSSQKRKQINLSNVINNNVCDFRIIDVYSKRFSSVFYGELFLIAKLVLLSLLVIKSGSY